MKMVYVMGPRTRGPAAPPGAAAPARSRVMGRSPAVIPAAPVAAPPAAASPGAAHADAPEAAAPAAIAAGSAAPETAAPDRVTSETAAPAAAVPDDPPAAVVSHISPPTPDSPAGSLAAALPEDPTVSVARAAADAFRPVVEQQAAWAGRRAELEQTYRRLQRQVQAQLSGLRVQLATRLRSRP